MLPARPAPDRPRLLPHSDRRPPPGPDRVQSKARLPGQLATRLQAADRPPIAETERTRRDRDARLQRRQPAAIGDRASAPASCGMRTAGSREGGAREALRTQQNQRAIAPRSAENLGKPVPLCWSQSHLRRARTTETGETTLPVP